MNSLHLTSLEPAMNLALEEALFDAMEAGHPGWLLIWQNRPCVIVGRFQNTVAEINQSFVRERELPVIRRMSGGGAVYHDTGNLNFSFIVPAGSAYGRGGDFSFADFLVPLADMFGELGVRAQISGRNDLLADGRKFSGSAQRRGRHAVLHHGTIMVDLDIDALEQALAVNPEKYKGRGVVSIRSRVTNLRPYLPDMDISELARHIPVWFKTRRVGADDPDLARYFAAADTLAREKYNTWEWNYGSRLPSAVKFNAIKKKRFPWGYVECGFVLENGIIADCRISGDFFADDEIARVCLALTGVAYKPDAMRAALSSFDLGAFFMFAEHEEVLALLAGGSV
jgi:lipoate-protein ligase A